MGKRERRVVGRRREGGKKGIEKERKEEEGIKKDRRQDKKEF